MKDKHQKTIFLLISMNLKYIVKNIILSNIYIIQNKTYISLIKSFHFN